MHLTVQSHFRRTGYTLGVEPHMSDYDTELSRIVEELNRAAPSQKPAAGASASTASLDQLLEFAARRNASDILLVAGAPAVLRVNGALSPGAGAPLEPEDIRLLLTPLLTASQAEEL